MRLHRLTLQAVGPFSGRHTIEIDALGASGLFLLEGPTGSGKTTLIDSIVFALYGDVADSDGSHKSRMHSQHAEPGVEPVVDLVFSTARGVYRVRRTPSFERPKQRGTGTTTVNPTAKLWRLSAQALDGLAPDDEPPGEQVSAHVQEVGTELGAILGLTRTQFTQTVVLPQGQFATFLRARVDERQAVLREIFGTKLYDDVQQVLADGARSARQAAERAATESGRAATAVAEHARLDPERAAALTEAAEANDADAVEEVLTPVLDSLEESRRSAATAHEKARTDDRAAQEQLDAQRALARAIERRTALIAERSALAEAADQVAADKDALEQDTRARPVVVALDTADRRRTDATESRARLAGLVETGGRRSDQDEESAGGDERVPDDQGGPSDGSALTDDPVLSDEAALTDDSVLSDEAALTDDSVLPDEAALTGRAEQLDEERSAAITEHGTLTGLLAVEEGIPGRRTVLDGQEKELAALVERIRERATEIEALPAARAELQRLRSAAQEEAADLSGARARAESAVSRLEASRLADARVTELEKASIRVERARKDAEKAGTHESDLRGRWRSEVAGHLATELDADTPCPVCGSTEHPDKAPLGGEPVSDDDLTATETARQAADAALAEASGARTRAEEQLAAAREAAGGLSLTDAGKAVETARAAVVAAEAQVAEAARLEAAITRHDAGAKEATEAQSADESRRASLAATLDSARTALESDEQKVQAARAGHASVADRAGALTARAERARILAHAVRDLLDRTRTAREAASEAEQVLAASSLSDAAAARAARLPDAERTATERRVQEHASSTARVTAGLAEDEIAALTGTEVSDLDGARTRREAAAAALEAASAAHSGAGRTLEDTTSAIERLRDQLRKYAARAAADAPRIRLADLASGRESRTSITLATYVLVRRFEEVLAAANERLTAMSTGRYALERTDEKEAGQRARAVGLGLRVLDTHTDAPRDPRTLSGGETFYVSLSLALGLADVVSAESGGIELGTLFVDEGFGTLDPETLDAVMNELGALRDSGRTVGLISHVGEMKQRIPDQVNVRHCRDGRGSTLSVRAESSPV
ncbi:MAG: AAA family ATPase [Actinomycetaceae bacterium]